MNTLQAIILAIIEGLTEFLPVSSTGHMIIASSLMGIAQSELAPVFTVAIQFGAILSVVVLYWRRFFENMRLYPPLMIAFIPAAFFGVLLGGTIERMLENVTVVALALFLGGVVLLFIDRLFPHDAEDRPGPVTWKNALVIGFFQVIAMIPGVSRSAATIIGGLTQKLSRKQAAEFSFFLAVPTMFAATCKSLWDYIRAGHSFTEQHWQLFAVGNAVAFIVAMLAIRGFVGFLTKHGFQVFGWYRIVVGGILLLLIGSGADLKVF